MPLEYQMGAVPAPGLSLSLPNSSSERCDPAGLLSKLRAKALFQNFSVPWAALSFSTAPWQAATLQQHSLGRHRDGETEQEFQAARGDL